MVDEEFLAHYGVKGMRWGVIRKRVKATISSGRKRVSKVLKKKQVSFKKTLKEKAKARKKTLKEKVKARKKTRALAKENGNITPAAMKKFNDVRKTTLASHDPAVVARGMHTLTDSELRKKIDRMKLESEVINIVDDRSKKVNDAADRSAKLAKARNEVKTSSVMGRVVENSTTNILTNAGKKATDKIFDEWYKKSTSAA